MSCNVDVLDVPARPTVEIECDRGTPVTAAISPTTAMRKIIKGFMRISCWLKSRKRLQQSD
jgi:hypothetical protein